MKSRRSIHRHARHRGKPPIGWPQEDTEPPREPTPDLRPGADIGDVVLRWHGQTYTMRFRVPGDATKRRARSDQIAADVGDDWRLMSLRAALLELERSVPRTLSRKERAAT